MSGWLPEDVVTEHLRLREHASGDREAIVSLLTDEEVRRYVGGPRTEADARSRPLDKAWGHFAVADGTSNQLVGTVSFDQKRGPWEISFQLRRSEWGKGLMSEAVRASREWFFNFNDADVFIAVTQVANERTRRLLERVGGQRVKELEQYGVQQVEYVFDRIAR